MFETYEDGRLFMPSSLYGLGEHSWEYVSLGIFVPWWLVTVKVIQSKEGTWTQTLLVKNVQQFITLGDQPNVSLKRVQLVRPNFSEISGWEMDDVVKILEGACDQILPDSSEKLIEYELSNGERFIYPGHENYDGVFNVNRQIYPAPDSA